MTVSVLHLSDIHIKTDDTHLLLEADEIAASFFEVYRSSDRCMIIVTGDVAYGGIEEEYDLAKVFFDKIKESLLKEKEIPIDFFLAPGNHDCKLVPEDVIRSTVIAAIHSENSKAKDPDIVEKCVSAQKFFIKFSDKLNPNIKFFKDPLWEEYEIQEGSKVIRVSIINASWMSVLKERPGTLVYPIENYEHLFQGKYDHRFTLIHHPMNWYCQDTYHNFRRLIQQHSSIVFSGHEHSALTSNITTSNNTSTLFFEGKALAPHSMGSEAGFSALLVDVDSGDVRYCSYTRTSEGYEKDSAYDHSASLYEKSSPHSITDGFIHELKDPGASLSLPSKSQVSISDIFISPELDCLDTGKSVSLDDIDPVGKKILITGDDQTGKTKTLHNLYFTLHEREVYPIYIDCRNIKRSTSNSMRKAILKAIEHQYKRPEKLNLLRKSNKAILLDNYEEIGALVKGLDSIFQYINDNYGTVIIACNSMFITASIASSKQRSYLIDFKSYKIKDFGCNLRYQLIKKWHLHEYEDGHAQTEQEFENKIHNSEKTITTVLGKNLVPSRPLYLLTLLQSSSSQTKEELSSSGMSYYYQFLITKSLDEAGVGQGSFDVMFNYLSHLAWFYRDQECDSLDESELNKFNKQFSDKFTTIKFEQQLGTLIKAKILIYNGGFYSFAYPYIKFFFLGKYFADHIEDEEIISIINQSCENLSTRDNSNIILFLTHHKNSDWVVDSISDNLSNCYYDYSPIEFNSDTICLNDIIGSVSEVVISDLNVEENKKQQRKRSEEIDYEPKEEQLDKGSEEYNRSIDDLFKLLRSSEVLGQILKNYFGSITREKKNEYLTETVNAPLRLLGFFISEIMKDPDNLAHQIESRLTEMNSSLSKAEVKEISAQFISEIINITCTGLISKTAEVIGSDKLKEDIDFLVGRSDNNAYKLIQAAVSLISPSKPPIETLKKLAKSLQDNPLAFKVLQSLVLYHIHMFHTPESEKQALGHLVKVNLKPIHLRPSIKGN
ncbi:metallophosphoesterase [Neptunomonas marina]|uniref:Metallophosphoesterase n=1 Tax=Neptunomonas marina TaxID=1815562 RepID=A0A437Q6F0_9GAMM|nr:metallophosphoesterase [Neptunomonas marina]RVU30090.1 metallophosphoesterase [Neptunomonas marina]